MKSKPEVLRLLTYTCRQTFRVDASRYRFFMRAFESGRYVVCPEGKGSVVEIGRLWEDKAPRIHKGKVKTGPYSAEVTIMDSVLLPARALTPAEVMRFVKPAKR